MAGLELTPHFGRTSANFRQLPPLTSVLRRGTILGYEPGQATREWARGDAVPWREGLMMTEGELVYALCLGCLAIGWAVALVVNDLTGRRR